MLSLHIDDTYHKILPADSEKANFVRQVKDACFSYVKPTPCSDPKWIHYSGKLAEELDLSKEVFQDQTFLKILSGNEIYPKTSPYAMCYGGHQFGSWAGQLGDGRAINLFETFSNGKRYQWQLKGAGKTPYSRAGDGLAVLRSSVREYLCSEAMYFLGVPTTRSLSLILTGDQVLRDIMYDGHPEWEKGAIVCRLAPSFIRFGHFQILAARGETKHLKSLTDYTIQYFYPHLGSPGKETYLAFFQEVIDRTVEMVLHWQRVGFVHGVMNTDNMAVLGLTIDYGPYGWLEDYDPNWTPNTTDAAGKRYRFGNQPTMVFWNLYQLANALYPLILDAAPLEDMLRKMQEDYVGKYLRMMKEKLGLTKDEEIAEIIEKLEDLLKQSELDMTLFYRKLSEVDLSNTEKFVQNLADISYAQDFERFVGEWNEWFAGYSKMVMPEDSDQRRKKMNQVNPKYVFRNYMAQMAIEAAEKGDYSLIDEFYTMLQKPYDEQPQYERWFAKRPDWAREKIGCSMLSCSS